LYINNPPINSPKNIIKQKIKELSKPYISAIIIAIILLNKIEIIEKNKYIRFFEKIK
jgi:hypothetical protein